MKIVTLMTALTLCVSSFASDIPEAKKFHPSLYTVQFTLAELPADFEMYNKSDPYAELSIQSIQNSEATFINLATIHTARDVEFSGNNGVVKGKLDSESNTLEILQLVLPNYEMKDPTTVAVSSDKWMKMLYGGRIVDGKEKKYCVLIKCYPPTK